MLVRQETNLLNALGIGMLLVAVFRMLFGMLRHYLLAYVARRIDLALMSRFSRHLLGLPMRFFDMRRVGEIISRLQDTAKVREAISGTTTSAIVDGTLVVVFVAILWYQDLPLALAASAFVPLLLLTIVAHHPAAKRRSREAMERASLLAAQVVEDVSAVETIKAFGVERDRSEQSEDRLVSFAQSTFSLQKLGLTMNGASTLVTAVAGLTVLWYGGHRVMAGEMSIGDLVFFNSVLAYLLEPLVRLASLNLQLQDEHVQKNQVLVRLDASHLDNDIAACGQRLDASIEELKRLADLEQLSKLEFAAARAKAQAELSLAEEDVRLAEQRRRADVLVAEAEVAAARYQVQLKEPLAAKGVVTASDLEESRRDLKRALAGLERARVSVNSAPGRVAEQSLRISERQHAVKLQEFALKKADAMARSESLRAERKNLDLERSRP